MFFLFAGASLLIVVPTLALIARAVERRVYERATEDLAGAANALGSNWSLRDEVLLNEAAARAQSSGLPAALAERDVPRIRQIFQRRPAAERIAVAADSAGNRLLGPTIDPTILSNNQGIGSILTYSAEDEIPLRVAVWPVWSDSGFAGVAGVGARVDSAAIRELKKDVTAGTEVALIIGDSIVGTTLPDSLRDGLARLQLGVGLRNGATGREILRGAPYQYRLSTLPTRGLPAAVLLFRPIQNELRIATGIQRTLFGIGFAALVLALLLAGVVARIVARPAQALADASARLARGDFRAPLPPASGDEIGQLTIAFAEMRTAIAEREGRLRSAQAEMIHREKLAAMGRLVAQLSHEINNPIYNIQNCLEALARRGDPHDPNREFLLLAQEELARMAALTRQMLDQSRPLSDAATPLDLNQVVK
ncbi:MAG: HAMP domain-containing protein, partial [Gemmatimonadota bacterium]|nr:HAMP domain-containing protein [Gemmatimonadota bacterium]